MNDKTHKLSFLEKLGYGSGDLASCLFWSTIMSQLLFFYTDVFKLTAVAAGIMFFVSRILDAVFDVVIGMTADRTQTRWGKFRPYILFGAVPLTIVAILTFTTPGFGYTGKVIYAYITFILFMLLYSTVNIPYTALLGVISGDPVERTSASSFKFTGAYLGGIIVSATVLPLAAYFGGTASNPKGWTPTMGLYGIAAVIFFIITFLSTKERIQPIVKEKTSVKNDLKDISKNIPWVLLFIVTILFILFVCIRLSVTTHYFKYYVGDQASPLLANVFNFFIAIINPVLGIFGQQKMTFFEITNKFHFEVLTSAFNVVGQGLSLVGVLLVPWFTKLAGRKNALIILFLAALFFTGSYFFFKPTDLVLIFVAQVFGSITGGPISALLWVMYADTADYSEWKNGRRATGLVFSASIMSNKIGWAVGSMIAGVILSMTGFVADQIQNVDVLTGLKSMMSIIPVAAGAIALIIIAFFYKLDETTMTKIKADLDERRKESSKEVAAAQ